MEEEKHGKICPNLSKLTSLRASRLLEIKVSVLQNKKKRHLKALSLIKSKQDQSHSPPLSKPLEASCSDKFKDKGNLSRPISTRKASVYTSSRVRISFSGDNWKEIRLNQTKLKCSFKKRVAEGLKKGRRRILQFWDEKLERLQRLRNTQKCRGQEETKMYEEMTQILRKRERTLLGQVCDLREQVERSIKGHSVGLR